MWLRVFLVFVGNNNVLMGGSERFIIFNNE